MNAVPPAFAASEEFAGHPWVSMDILAERWSALNSAAAVVAHLAQIAPPQNAMPLATQADPIRIECVRRGIDDLVAVLQTGIAALLAVNDRNGDPRPAALSLWNEFNMAREAVLSLLGPPPAFA
ncbi:MAG TPA: hypothetical protein VKY80_11845 [Croceibacterium sp.]|nr:hypothetical protein [Croceibacterium sp.]